MPTSRTFRSTLLLVSLVGSGSLALSQSVPSGPAASVAPLITAPVNEAQLTMLPGNVHPLARPEFDAGAAPDNLPMDRMMLMLKRSPSQQASLTHLLDAQQDKTSSNYHRWLTPQEFGVQFGLGDRDLQVITAWLKGRGFTVAKVAQGRTFIEFSGTAGQVRSAFHAEVHKFLVNGEEHWANAGNPQLPTALTAAVKGIASLHNFQKYTNYVLAPDLITPSPDLTARSGSHYIAPADFATIYNTNPLFQAGITGTGTTIAVVARSNINISDVNQFRSFFGLPVNPPRIIVNGPDPGIGADQVEAVLDASWSGAVAPGAAVNFVVSASTNTADGVDLSEAYIVDNNLGNVMTESYGYCEAFVTANDVESVGSIAEQAAAQGITYMVSTGDSGATGCDLSSATRAVNPPSTNYLSSTPFTVAVGGTQFNDLANPSLYWNSANNATTRQSVKSYIPENVWNQSCIAGQCATPSIVATGGGPSMYVAKPSWQRGVPGLPSDGVRDTPDVSLNASAAHDAYALCLFGSCATGGFYGIGGTSVSAPAFAGIMALVNQATGSRQGQANYVLYSMAAAQAYSGCNSSVGPLANTCVFNDITVGDNAVPGEVDYGTNIAQFQATYGYDLATGLGSVNAYNLATQWTSFSAPAAPANPSDFGSVPVNSTSANATLTFALSGQSSTPTFALKYGTDFQLGTPSCTVGISTVCSLPVAFAPTYPGLRKDAVIASYGTSSALKIVSLIHGIGLGPQAAITPGLISTAVGTGVIGYSGNGGSAATATLYGPTNVAFDPANNLYIADTLNNVIRRVDSSTGLISTVAGNGVAALYGDGGPASAASLYQPTGIAVNGAGDIYLADTANAVVRKVDGQTGIITSVAGIGTNGFSGDGSSAVTASLNRPAGIAVDPSGNLYIADTYNAVVRRVDAVTGLISTVVGAGGVTGFSGSGGPGTSARLSRPAALAMDAAGNLFISDPVTFAVWKLNTATDIITLVAGTGAPAHTGDGGPAAFAQLFNPSGLAVDAAGNLYIGETGTGNIRTVLAGTGIITTVAGQAGFGSTGNGGSAATAKIAPYGMAMDQTGNLYVAAFGFNSVRKITAAGAISFGAVATGTTSSPVSATLSNIGNQPSPVGTVSVTAAFAQSDGGPTACSRLTTLTSGTTCVYNFTFSPTYLGNYSGSAALMNGQVTLLGSGLGVASSTATAYSNLSIDVPGPQTAPLQGTAMFAGWALNSLSPVQTLLVSVDGAANGNATLGLSRPDVCQLYPFQPCPNVGWSYYLDTTKLVSGSHSLQLTATLANGQHISSGSTFTVGNWTATNPFRINIDQPSANATVTGITPIGGWAIAGSIPVNAVTVAVDGITQGSASVGGARPDVCAAFPSQAGCPNVGWNYVLNTAALANGSHTLQVTASALGGQASTVTSLFTVTGNPVRVNIDSPARSSTFSGMAAFGGWAISDNSAVSFVALSVDGIPVGNAVYGGSRPDVCNAFPNRTGCPNVGWNFSFDATQLSNGTHTLRTIAYGNARSSTSMTTFTVANASSTNPVKLNIDQPTTGGSVLGIATFSGWALAGNSPLISVQLSVDNVPVGAATYGSFRPDVCVFYPGSVGCPNVGWTFTYDTRALTTGMHMLAVKAVTTAGSQSTITSTFNTANWTTTANPITLSIDNPNSNTGPLSGLFGLGGWALNRFSPISSVSIAVDGIPYGNAAYGGTRFDVCAGYSNQPGCPNVGWNAQLDITYLLDGAHTLDVTATPAAGQSFTTSASFTVANARGNPVRINIDAPAQSASVNGTVSVYGWAVSDTTSISSVQILVDGTVYGAASYGSARGDVCAVYPGRSGCPNVGWTYQLDTTLLANGSHTLEITATGADGKRQTIGRSLVVAN